MPREEEVNDIPEPRQYEVLPEGSYTGHIWEKKPRITRNKRDGSGTFDMWPLSFRLTHKANGEELRKPVIVYTDFFGSQMVKLQVKVGGHPIQGKPVLVDVIVDEYEALGDVEMNEDGTFKTEFDGKVKRKKTKRQVSRIDRGEGGRGEPVVDLNPKGQVITLDAMDVLDLEEGRTRDAPDAQTPYGEPPF